MESIINALNELFQSIVNLIKAIFDWIIDILKNGLVNDKKEEEEEEEEIPVDKPIKTGKCISDDEKVTLNLTTGKITCNDGTDECLEIYNNKLDFLKHMVPEGQEASDPLYTGFLFGSGDDIVTCPEPPKGGGGGGGGTSLTFTTTGRAPESSTSRNIEPIDTEKITFVFSCNDLIHNQKESTKPDKRIFLSISFFQNSLEILEEIYTGSKVITTPSILNSFQTITVENVIGYQVTLLAVNEDITARIAYRGFSNLKNKLNVVT